MNHPQDENDPARAPEVTLKRLLCHRTGQQYDLSTHERCPYCWAGRELIERGEHVDFCDYDPVRDPVHFGFPKGATRDLSG